MTTLLALFAPATALAQPSGPQHGYAPWETPAATRQPPREWYGWQSVIAYLVTDAAVVGSVVLASETSSASETIPVAIALRAHAGMVVHFAHGNWGKGGASLALVGGGSVVGGAIGATTGVLVGDSSGDFGSLGSGLLGLAIGGGVGAAIGSVLDIGLLAYDESEPPPMSVTVLPTPSGPVMGLSGRF
jgi:hypothetical protein